MSETGELTPMQRIAQILVAGDLEVLLGRIGEDAEIEKLHVILGRDKRQREYLLQILFVSDITESLGLDVSEDGYDSVLLQFFLLLPYDIQEQSVGEALRVVNRINRGLPIGHIGVSEPDRAFYLSYQLALEDREISAMVLQDVVGLLGFAVASYGDVLDQVASGAMTAEQFTAQLQALGLEMPPARSR